MIGAAVAFIGFSAVILSVSTQHEREAIAMPVVKPPITMAVTAEPKTEFAQVVGPEQLTAPSLPPEIEIDTPMLARPRRATHPAASTAYGPEAFRLQWQTVGEELYAYTRAHGVNATIELQSRYTTISYLTAAATQEGRDQARKQLDAIHEKLTR